jgi:predicted ribosome quality control (RQC) complex YloA/Tae2 family protein
MKTELYKVVNLEMPVEYLIGKSAQDNFDCIDIGAPDDIWFHIKDVPSCHVIAKISEQSKLDKKITQTIVKHGALLCKQNSKYKSSSNVEIIYTKLSNVTKSEPVGSVIAENTKTIMI